MRDHVPAFSSKVPTCQQELICIGGAHLLILDFAGGIGTETKALLHFQEVLLKMRSVAFVQSFQQHLPALCHQVPLSQVWEAKSVAQTGCHFLDGLRNTVRLLLSVTEAKGFRDLGAGGRDWLWAETADLWVRDGRLRVLWCVLPTAHSGPFRDV